jgi:hypothetical protein
MWCTCVLPLETFPGHQRTWGADHTHRYPDERETDQERDEEAEQREPPAVHDLSREPPGHERLPAASRCGTHAPDLLPGRPGRTRPAARAPADPPGMSGPAAADVRRGDARQRGFSGFSSDTLTRSYHLTAERERVRLALRDLPAPRRRPVSDTATTPGPAPVNSGAIVHFLSAVHHALDLPAPRRGRHRLRYLRLLDQRARLARACITRLISNPDAEALDYTSEGDHLLHGLADLPPDSYRHHPTQPLPPGAAVMASADQTEQDSPGAASASRRRQAEVLSGSAGRNAGPRPGSGAPPALRIRLAPRNP